MEDSKRQYKPTPGVNNYQDGSHIIIQGKRRFFEYMPNNFAIYDNNLGKSYRYIQCPDCGLIWGAGCGLAKHTCKH